MKFYGNLATYTCTESLGGGAEGKVYAVNGRKHAVKVFSDGSYLLEASQRVDHMLKTRPPVMVYSDGDPMFAWPQDKVYSAPGKERFVGYAMPKLGPEYHSIAMALRPDERLKWFGKDSLRLVTALAYNFVEVVRSLNAAGYHLSDMNPANIFLNKKGHICFIDTDSLCFSANGFLYTPNVTTFEFLPPELQCFHKKNTAALFGDDADRFMVAVLIWQLLLYNTHPFQKGHFTGLKNKTTYADNIAYGGAEWNKPSPGWPNVQKIFPPSTVRLFGRVFGYTHYEIVHHPQDCIKQRPTLDEWHSELASLLGL